MVDFEVSKLLIFTEQVWQDTTTIIKKILVLVKLVHFIIIKSGRFWGFKIDNIYFTSIPRYNDYYQKGTCSC